MKKLKGNKKTSWIRPAIGALLINGLLLLVMLNLLDERPADQFREYYTGRQEFDTATEVFGDLKFTMGLSCHGGEDSFELYMDSKGYEGSFTVTLLNGEGKQLKTWTTDKMRILDEKQGEDRWLFYEADADLFAAGNEYYIEVSAPELNENDSVTVKGYSVYRMHKNYFAVAAFILLFITANIWWFNIEKPIEKWSFWVLLGTGLIMFFIMSPSSQTDEANHYYGTLKVSNLILGREDLNDIEGEYFAKLKQHYNSNESFMKLMQNIGTGRTDGHEDAFICRNTFSFIQPASYIVPAIGMSIGRLLGADYYLTYSLARFFNLLFFVFMAWLAIRLMPYNKELILMVGMLPMAMHQAASLSYDVIVNGLSLILFAYVVKIIDEKKELSWKNAMIIAGILGTLGPVKVVYCTLVLLVFMIPSKQFKGLKDRLFKCMFIIAFTVGILWIIRSPDIVSRVDGSNFGEVNPYYDMNYVMGHPFGFMKLLANSIWHDGKMYIYQAVGYHMAGTSVSLAPWCIRAYLLMLVLNQLFQEKNDAPGIRQRAVALGMSVITLVGIVTTMALAYTYYGSERVSGVQGRYFIPIMALVLYSLSVSRIPKIINRKYFTGIAWIVYLSVIVEVMSRIRY